jgi:glycosyltransferase involved in cell wall biosynthesis
MDCRNPTYAQRQSLFIEQCIPQPNHNAGAITVIQFMELFLRAGWGVTLWPQDGRADIQDEAFLKKKGIDTLSFNHSPQGFKAWWRANAHRYSHVLLSRPAVCTAFLPILRRYGSPRILFYGHDLHFARLRSEAELTGAPELSWLSERYRKMESRIWENVDCVYYPSVEEVAVVHSMVPKADARSVIPYFFEETPPPDASPPDAQGILFVGNFRHPPNVDAAEWLIQTIWPEIRRHCPAATLRVVGSGIPASIRQRSDAEAGIDISGWLPDEALAAAYRSCRVAVVPLRFGAGIKHKVVAALAVGRPVVTTRVGMQGLACLNDSVCVADNDMEFAMMAAQLLTDDAYWLLQAGTGLEAIRSRFTADIMASAFDELEPLRIG